MAKANQATAVQQLKDQAERLAEYLESQGRKVTRTQALEAMSRALHGKPWNTVQAMLTPEPAPRTYWALDREHGELPVNASISLGNGVIVFGVGITAYLDRATSADLLELLECDGSVVGTRHLWFLDELLRTDSPFSRPVDRLEVTVKPSEYTLAGVLSYMKAFRPKQFLAFTLILCQKLLPHADVTWLSEFEVVEAADEPGQWLWVSLEPLDGAEQTFSSREQAEAALVDEWLRAHPDLFAAQKRVTGIEVGSGILR